MATPDRQELVRNAVTFLSDPKAQASPLAQRVQFLEAKGLTAPEIEEAMRQAAMSQSAPRAAAQPYAPSLYGPVYGPMPYSAAQHPPQPWDWRDYFITAVVSGTVAYGAASLFRKFVSPHLKPPSATAYEEDKDAMAAQFDAAEALLQEIQAETAAVRAAVDEQNDKVAKVTADVENAVKDMREGESRTRDEMREIREEVNTVREMLPKMIEKNKESQNQSLAELQQELKSLKALLLSRGPSISAGPATPIFPGKPSIPAWQLAGASAPSSFSSPPVSSPSTPVPVPSAPISPPIPNGKGKEVAASEPTGTP
ncbi:peroxisomal membrane anchor protein conserved region-domain-containing protein [Trametes elegans]|nr:peroxisomal membrane anchor protein conserved region-domain-containing protein [Trametes elegans]